MPTIEAQRVQWGEDLGRLARWPLVTNLLISLVAWETAEGGGFGNVAAYNPLNTTLPAEGSHGINGVNVQAYPSYNTGLAATLETLQNGDYASVVQALSQGFVPSTVAQIVGDSPWGTPARLIVECIPAAARAVADYYQVPGEPKMFIQDNKGNVYEEVVTGGETIWRGLDPNLLPTLPTAWIVPDPLGHWLNRFAVKPAV
jgi:hypothetical protein